MRVRKLLLLGGTGYVGHHLAPRLGDAGFQVTVPTRNRMLHRELALVPRLRLVQADIHDEETLAALVAGQDVVINLVGILNESRTQRFEQVHAGLARSLASACTSAHVPRLLQMSALGAEAGESNYLRSRARAEEAVRGSGLDWTILRASVIFGGEGGLVARFAGLLRLLPVLPLPQPGAQMAPVHVDDVAEALLRAIDAPGCARRSLELYGPETLSLLEIVRAIAGEIGGRAVLPMPGFLGRIQAAVAGLAPGKPFTLDNFRSLQTPSVGTQDGLRELGIEPQVFSACLPLLIREPSRAAQFNAIRAWRNPD